MNNKFRFFRIFTLVFCLFVCTIFLIQESKIKKIVEILNIVYDIESAVKSRIDIIENEIKNSTHQKVIITGYHPPSKGINSDGDYKTTAIMKKPISGWTVAISKELVDMGWLNKKIYIDGYGIRKATDRMNNGLKGKRVDLCVGNLKEAIKIGKQENILAVVLN